MISICMMKATLFEQSFNSFADSFAQFKNNLRVIDFLYSMVDLYDSKEQKWENQHSEKTDDGINRLFEAS